MAGAEFQHEFLAEADHQYIACARKVIFLAPQLVQQTTPPTPAFMSLPPEVRVHIYRHYFDDICVVVNEPGSITLTNRTIVQSDRSRKSFDWICYNQTKQANHSIALMFTCLDVYHEIVPTLYETVVLFFERRLDFKSVHDCGSLDINNKIAQVQRPPPVFNPLQHVQKLSINLASCADFGKRLNKDESRRATESILDIATYSMPKLKHLQLEINHRAGVFTKESNGLMQAWFLRRLCRMKHLQYLGINYRGVTARTRSPKILNASACTFALQCVLKWHCYGGAESWAVELEEPFNEESLNDRTLQLRVGKAVMRFLQATENKWNNHGDLLMLLKADVDKFTLL